MTVPHFMEGNVVGTFVSDLVTAMAGHEVDFESNLNLSKRIYEARKENDAEAMVNISTEVLCFAIARKLPRDMVAELEPWPERFKSISIERIANDLIENS